MTRIRGIRTGPPAMLTDRDTQQGRLRAIIDRYRPDLVPFEDIYKEIHHEPELGEQEEGTSTRIAAHLTKAKYEVTTKIGGYGLVGVMKNGKGPTILLRSEMDALPIREETDLPYASTRETVDTDGRRKPVMHACGHDMHMASMMAAATLLSEAKEDWNGTLIILFQPDEEHGQGAQAMVDDGLYKKIPKPDLVLGQHLFPYKTGDILIRPGVFMAAANTLHVTIFGQGSHAARPQEAIDPVVLAAFIIVRLQTVVSREIAPADAASVTCATIHGGDAYNVIPDQVELTINIRTFDNSVREKILSVVRRIIKAEAEASGVTKLPIIKEQYPFPLTENDPATTEQLRAVFEAYFGEERVKEAARNTASEDFSNLATAVNAPYVFWNWGGVDLQKWEDSKKSQDRHFLPLPHESKYAPVIQPTLKTGVDTLALAALTFLGPNGFESAE